MGILVGVFIPCLAYPTSCGAPDYPCCSRLSDDADWEDHQELRRVNSATFIVKVDSLLGYVSVWANYMQSGPIALVFAVLPTFELTVDSGFVPPVLPRIHSPASGNRYWVDTLIYGKLLSLA